MSTLVGSQSPETGGVPGGLDKLASLQPEVEESISLTVFSRSETQ